MTFVRLRLTLSRLRSAQGCDIVAAGGYTMTTSPGVNYDQSAAEYAAHRQIHSGVFDVLCRRVRLEANARVLEVGCGTGNYVSALVAR